MVVQAAAMQPMVQSNKINPISLLVIITLS